MTTFNHDTKAQAFVPATYRKGHIMPHKLTQTEWENDICIKILHLIQNELYLDFRYFDLALSALTFEPKESILSFATDGIRLFFSSEQVIRVYRDNPLFLNRAYLHSVLHCIFRHLWLRGKRNPVLWNLACDIAVEQVIDSFSRSSVKRTLSLIRLQYYEHLKKENIPVTAAAIYRDLLTITDPEAQMRLQYEFYTDDHRFWPSDQNQSPASKKAGENWEKIGRRTTNEMELHGKEDSAASSSIETQIAQSKFRRSYRDFLRKFMVLKEELHCDYDEFDLGFYTYGLRIYNNMPLIEPLESREVMKISEFVIVIDTSYSTKGELVKRFLEETFQIIHQKDSFFHHSHIRILQCDNQVQSDITIRNEDDMNRLLKIFTLTGGGGTDFRPAFFYVNELISKGTFQHLKGLLYFTDGKGIYPARRPEYETAFLFIDNEEHPEVPAWAMKIYLEEEEFL